MSELALRLIAENKETKSKILDLGNCGLTEVPEEIGELVWLEEISLSNKFFNTTNEKNDKDSNKIQEKVKFNSIQSIVWIKKLKKLKKILIAISLVDKEENLPLVDLAPLSELTSLEYLDIKGTSVNDLSPVSNLINLSFIDCSNTYIVDLSAISKLINLKYFYFSGLQVDDIQPLSGLLKLRILDCSRTKVINLSPITKLSSLQILNCDNTLVVDISPVEYLTNLENISCSKTKVREITPLKKLNNLKKANFSYSQVNDIYPIFQLIKENKLVFKDYTTWSGKIRKFFEFGDYLFNHCPLTTPPPEIVQQGSEAILRYFDEREKSGTDQIYEAKLLLIGEGGAGKTTLCRKLFNADAELPKEKDSTQGIDIQPLYFDLPNGKKFRLNVWDFAGQGKYQSAHSFFYTHRSLYVLVDDTRTLDENEAYRTFYNHWLQTAELFGGNSPLLVLHNQKADRVRTGFNLGSFQATFPFVKELFRTNLGSNDIAGVQDLRTQIERWAQKLPHIGDVVPKTWVKVRAEIEAERQARPFISYERYCELCAKHGITDELKQADLSRYFHDLGVFLHFQENPLLRRDVFLQNQWVTDAVYKILDDHEIAVKQRGRFNKADLARLWNEGFYTKRREELLALMLQFELCYQVQDTDTYVAPQLLPGDIPAYDLGTQIPLQLKYEYGFMPKGLLYRLIVRLHRHIAQAQSAVWNSGVVLERAGAQADVLESLDRRQISLRATGTRSKELIIIIAEEVDKLHASYGERLKVEVKIPCNCRVCKAGKTPHFYDKKDLDNRLKKGKPTVECKESFDDVNVQGLLYGVFTKDRESSRNIPALLSAGEIEKALKAMQKEFEEASELLGQFKFAKKENLGGRIDFKEFEKIQNRIATAAWELLR